MESVSLLEDIRKTVNWMSENLNEDSAYILTLWINKMFQQLVSNEKELQELIKSYKEKEYEAEKNDK